MKKQVIISLLLLVLLFGGCGKKDPAESKTDLGMKCIEIAEYENAISYFQEAVDDRENLQLAYRGAGIAYMNQEKYDLARQCFVLALQEASLKITDTEMDISYYMAAAQYKSGDYTGAIQTYTNMLAFRKKDADLYYLRGIAYITNGNYELATADFNKSIELSPKDYDKYIQIYQNLKIHGYEEDGKVFIQNALKIASEKNSETFNRGRLYYYLGDYESARTELEKAKTSGNLEAVLYLGKTYEALEDSNYAITLYEDYIEQDNTNGEAYNLLGLCRMALGKYEEALKNFQAGLETGDASAKQSLLFNEIVAYEYMGDFKTAAKKMEEYTAIYPEDSAAARENEFLKTR